MLQKSEEPTPQAITQSHMHVCVCVCVCVRMCACVFQWVDSVCAAQNE